MSEDNKIPPPPPPDDFTKTTPNIPAPKIDAGASDWDKTNYNLPKSESSDWGKTVTNLKPIDTSGDDGNKTFYAGAKTPSTPEWGLTEPNIKINDPNVGMSPDEFARAESFDKTPPYFQLPEAEKAKYQQIPPTPTEAAEQRAAENTSQGGIPSWVWIAAGAMTFLFFVIVALMAAYFFYGRNTSYEVRVTNVPVGSTVKLNGSPIAVSDDRGAAVLQNIKSGEHNVTIEHPTRSCDAITIRDTVKEVVAQCKEIKAGSTDDCGNIKFGEDDKAERCYNTALDALSDPFTPEDLVKALNILIINFASGSSDVPQKRLAALKKGAGFIQKLPSTVVLEVGGHTDNVGQAASNQTLSESRSSSVKEVLVRFGVKADMLQTKGYGSTVALTTNDTEDGKYRNRRIEYSVLRK